MDCIVLIAHCSGGYRPTLANLATYIHLTIADTAAIFHARPDAALQGSPQLREITVQGRYIHEGYLFILREYLHVLLLPKAVVPIHTEQQGR